MSSLILNWGSEKIKVDEFYKSLLFQRIMDTDFDRDERDVMLVVSRKTMHFDKWYDRLPTYHFSRLVGVGERKLRIIVDQLEAKGMLSITRTKGGRIDGDKKYNEYSLSDDFLHLVSEKWVKIKNEGGFDL